MTHVGIGVVGLGFMGRRHAINAALLDRIGVPCSIEAVYSEGVRSPEDLAAPAATGNIAESSGVSLADVAPRVAPSYEALLADPRVGLVIVCTPTPTHVALSVEALRAGKHVLVEKPVALSEQAMRPLIECAATMPGLVCMPAHVMRFWPGWVDLAGWVDDGRFGRVLSASFQRLGSVPAWNPGFYGDEAESGGALVDLHLHDVDFILRCFGEPDRVAACGGINHVTGVYTYDDGPGHVTAEAGWDQQRGAGFTMRFVVNFERATVDFDLSRLEPLRVVEGDKVTEHPGLVGDGYAGELRAVVEAIAEGRPGPVGLDDAARAARVIDRERVLLG